MDKADINGYVEDILFDEVKDYITDSLLENYETFKINFAEKKIILNR